MTRSWFFGWRAYSLRGVDWQMRSTSSIGFPAIIPRRGFRLWDRPPTGAFSYIATAKPSKNIERFFGAAPDAYLARRQLAHLLNRQGRRHEAAEQIRALCEQGNVRQDELHALVALSDAMYDDPAASGGRVRPNAYVPIGPAAETRRLLNRFRYREAAETLRPSVVAGGVPSAISALYGRALSEAQDDARYVEWLSVTDDDTRECAEFWAGLGGYLVRHRRFDEAARALAEAVDRDPTDVRSMGRLHQVLVVLKRDSLAELCEQRWTRVRDSVRLNNRVVAADTNKDAADAMLGLAAKLDELSRPLEALLWRSLAANLQGQTGALPALKPGATQSPGTGRRFRKSQRASVWD